MNLLSQLLIEYRKTKRFTQENLVIELSNFSDDFKALNIVTLSRWETGTTSPSIRKKRILLQYFAKNNAFHQGACYNIFRKGYEMLYEPLSKIFSKEYQYLIGNLPEQRGAIAPKFHKLCEYTEKHSHIEHIVDIEIATNATDYYTPTYAKLSQWCDLASTFAVIAERKKQHLGHMIMFKIKNHVAKEIAYNKRSEFNLNKDDFCAPYENGTYYVHALYGRSPKVAAMLNVRAYLHLFEYMNTTDNIMIFSSRTDGVTLTKNYGIEIVANGKNDEYGFDWYGMFSPVEDILFSDTIIQLSL